MTKYTMKRQRSSSKRAGPIEVKSGSAVVNIYPIVNRGRTLYTVTHYPARGQRRRQNFADLTEAKAEAYRLAANLQKGDIEVLQLSNKDRSLYLHPLAEIKPTGRSLELLLGRHASLVEAVRFFLKHHSKSLPTKPVGVVVEE